MPRKAHNWCVFERCLEMASCANRLPTTIIWTTGIAKVRTVAIVDRAPAGMGRVMVVIAIRNHLLLNRLIR
jgi:hypothetical protein